MCVDIKGNIPLPFIKCLKTLECSYSVTQWVKSLGFHLMMMFNGYQLLQVIDTKEGTESKKLPKWSLSLQCFQTISIRSSETDSDWTIHNNVPSKRQRLKDICSSVCAVSVVYKQGNVTCMLISFVFILCHQLQVGFSYLSHIIEHLFSELLLQTLSMLQNKNKQIRRRVKNYLHYRYMFCSWLYYWLVVKKYTWSTPLLPL
jgi:hypothetical protein